MPVDGFGTGVANGIEDESGDTDGSEVGCWRQHVGFAGVVVVSCGAAAARLDSPCSHPVRALWVAVRCLCLLSSFPPRVLQHKVTVRKMMEGYELLN